MISPQIHFPKKSHAIYHVHNLGNNTENDKRNRILKMLNAYDKGHPHYRHFLFEKTPVTHYNVNVYPNHKIIGLKEKNKMACMKTWMEACDQYIIHLPIPEIYALFFYDDVLYPKYPLDQSTQKTNKKEYWDTFLFQFYEIYRKNNVPLPLTDFYHTQWEPSAKDIQKAYIMYVDLLNKIIHNAPPIPPKCAITLYRGVREPHRIFDNAMVNLPKSATFDKTTAKLYMDNIKDAKLFFLHLKPGVSVLPLFFIDVFSYEKEVLVPFGSNKYVFETIKETPKTRHINVYIQK